LNLAELIGGGEHNPGLGGPHDFVQLIGDRYNGSRIEIESGPDTWEIAAVRDSYPVACRARGVAFAAVGEMAAAVAISSDPAVKSNSDPEDLPWFHGPSRNPTGWDDDELNFELWSRAHDVVPLPNFDVHRRLPETKGNDHE
jgi:hypothetical protein